MKIRFFIIIVLILMIGGSFYSYDKSKINSKNNINNSIIKDYVASDNNNPNSNTASKNDVTKINVIKDEIIHREQFTVNKTSGEVRKLPWENDMNFINAKEKYGTPILMNAYCAVLNDPLPGEKENVQIGTKLLCGTVIEAEKIFSQNKTIGPYIKSRGYLEGPTYYGTHLTTTTGGGVCMIASTLYNVAIKSNMQIIERHAHNMPVSYVPYGQDATVYYGSLDIKFKNNTKTPVLIWAQAIDKYLYIGFYGNSVPPNVEWHHQVLSTKKTTKVYKVNRTLPEGQVKLIVEGMDGATLRSWVTVRYQDRVITKQLGESVYLPLAYIYEKSS